jgi:hypothetical protein
MAKTGFADGTCQPVTMATDPDGECAATAMTSCGTTGDCDGVSACAYWDNATLCDTANCTGGVLYGDSHCDGAGTCSPDSTMSCDGHRCNGAGSACRTTCTNQSQCLSGYYCDGSNDCIAQAALGQSCGNDIECLSGNCVDGVCCDTACAGTCEACANSITGAADGSCTAIAATLDPENECTSVDLGCDGSSQCAACSYDPPAPGTPNCPNICTSCDTGTNTCTIDCDNDVDCYQETVTCPAGWNCHFDCRDWSACRESVFNCPDLYNCTFDCRNGNSACEDSTINCSQKGDCNVQCGGGDDCQNLDVNCGDNECTASCQGGDFPSLTCNGSCNCNGC